MKPPFQFRRTLELLCLGLTNRQIALFSGRNEETVKSHVKYLLAFYGAKNRTHLAAMAIRAGDVEREQ